MRKYIALLRGINVSGQKKIKMAELRDLLEKAGLKEVQTYIQSGNIVFSSTEKDARKNAEIIEVTIENAYKFHVPTLVITHEFIASVLKNNPFIEDENKDQAKMYFTFLYSSPTPENLQKFNSYSFINEEVKLNKSIAYVYYVNGAGKAKLTGNFMENKLKVTMSSRNYNTVLKLIEMSK